MLSRAMREARRLSMLLVVLLGVLLAHVGFAAAQSNPVPTLSSISPTSATAGGAAFTLTATGKNFISSSVVRWNGSNRTTTFVSSTKVTAQILASDIATAGTAQVTVFNPTPGGGTSAAKTFTINNPAPTLSSISPSSAAAGSGAFTLTVTGTNFVVSSVVRWNASNRTTTFVSSTQLQAAILASDIASTGTAQVTVFNSTPGGGTSTAQTFTITATNPVPTLSSISPSSATAGGAAFTLTTTGTNFVITSVVRWNGSNRTTTYVSSTQLQASITAADIAAAGTASVTVFNPTPGGGTSSAQTFTINNPAPTLSSISPASATGGGAAFTLTATGTNFNSSSVVRWNGSNRTTTFVSSTQIQASITAADIATAGTASVTVFNPTPGGGTSSAQTFTINNPAPTLSSISPTSATAGGAAFTLTATGTNFNGSSVVRWNGSDRTTTFVSATQLQASITAADIATAGTAPVTVFNPAPGGGTSSAQTFTITSPNPAPTLSSISPTTVVAGSAAFTLTVNGTNFISSSVVRWNGSDRSTTFVNGTQLQAQITAADVAAAGTAQVRVFTPAPGGGTSNPGSFTVSAAPVLGAVSYVYDDLNRLSAVVDHDGNAAVYVYDAVGNILAIQRSNAADIPGPVGITLVAPSRAGVGTAVQIFGKGFIADTAANTVTFNGTAATVVAAATNSLVTSVPAGATTGRIVVTNAQGSATSPTDFTVSGTVTVNVTTTTLVVGEALQFQASEGGNPTSNVTWAVNGITGGDPSIGTISSSGVYTAPAWIPPGAVNTPITITATIIGDRTASATATISLVNPNIVLSVAGGVSVQVQDGQTFVTSTDGGVSVSLAPVITSISPSSAPHNTTTSVTLTGAGFTGATGLSAFPATNLTFSNFQVVDDATVTAQITSGSTAGVWAIQIITPSTASTRNGTGSNLFTVTP